MRPVCMCAFAKILSERLYKNALLLYNVRKDLLRVRRVKYIGSAFRYVFKNFIFIFLFALLPSYFFAASLDLNALGSIVDNILHGRAELSFPQLFSAFSLFNAARWQFGLVSFALTAIFMPMLLAFVEKHMRIGSRSLRGVAKRINYNFVSTFILIVLAVGVYELWAVLASGLIYACSLILDGIAQLIAALLLAFGMMALLSYIASIFMLWLPCLHITGYSFLDALVFSNQLSADRKGKIYLSVFLPFVAGVALVLAAVGVCGAYKTVVPVFVIIELIYLLLFLYFNVLMYAAYFDAAGEERGDLKKRF